MTNNNTNMQNQGNMNASNDQAAVANSYNASASTAPQSGMQQNNMAMAQNNMAQNNTQPKAVVGVFRDLTSAEQSVTQLRSNGFGTEEINLLSKDTRSENGDGSDSIMDGTMTGGAIGGIGGLLLSAGAMTIPGLGPILAAGPIAATITGAIGGGITGGLIDWGIPSAKSEEYSNQVSSGNTLAVIKAPASKVSQAVQILTANGAMNIETHDAK